MRRAVEAVDHRSGARESVEILQLDDPLEAGLSVAILSEHPGDPPDGWPARSGRSRGGPQSQAHKEDGLRVGFACPNAQAGNRQQANQRP